MERKAEKGTDRDSNIPLQPLACVEFVFKEIIFVSQVAISMNVSSVSACREIKWIYYIQLNDHIMTKYLVILMTKYMLKFWTKCQVTSKTLTWYTSTKRYIKLYWHCLFLFISVKVYKNLFILWKCNPSLYEYILLTYFYMNIAVWKIIKGIFEIGKSLD